MLIRYGIISIARFIFSLVDNIINAHLIHRNKVKGTRIQSQFLFLMEKSILCAQIKKSV